MIIRNKGKVLQQAGVFKPGLPAHAQNLIISDQLLAQRVVLHILHGKSLVNSMTGRCGSRLTEDHKYRLHADRAIGNVGRGCTDWHQEVVALVFFGGQAVIGDGIGPDRLHMFSSHFFEMGKVITNEEPMSSA